MVSKKQPTKPRGRPAKFRDDDILDAALAVFSREGPRGVSMSAVARELGAPSGSLYYRFTSRDHLLAELWLKTVEAFQSALLAQLGDADPVETVAEAAVWVVRWCRAHPHEGRLLLLHRRADLLDGSFPSSLARRARAAGAQLEAMADRVRGLGWADPPPDPYALRFALADLPAAAVRAALASGEPIPPVVDALVKRAAVAVLRPSRGG